jgi:hypothetical protein
VLLPLTAFDRSFEARGAHRHVEADERLAISTIGIDTGKNTLHMIDLDEKGAIILREKIARHRIAARLVNVPPCLVGIEVGMATHYMARELVALGHEVKQVPPAFAKPFRQGHVPIGDIAVPHSITSSARTKNDSGTTIPRALAVMRLTISSNFVGCSTGILAGLPPCKILVT